MTPVRTGNRGTAMSSNGCFLAPLARAFTSILLLLGSGILAPADCQSRRWLPTPVLQASIVDRDGTRFGNPTQIVALPAGGFAVVHDYAEVHAFDSAAEPDWRYGRRGEGPHEFGFIQDIDVSPADEVFILDRDLGRVSVIHGRTGRLEIAFHLPFHPSPLIGYGILPGHAEARALIIPEQDKDATLWVAVRDDGRRLASESMIPEVECDHNLTCEFFATVAGNTGSAVAFRWSSKLLFLELDGSVRAVTDGVEEIPFPEVKTYDQTTNQFGVIAVTRVDPQAPIAVLAITANSSHLFVSFAGLTEQNRRIVDVYSVVNGDYQGSYLFPAAIGEMAILSDGTLATLDVEYYPTVQLWELAW